MSFQIPPEEYEKIEEWIAQADSPVGIDAKKTHILILHKLLELEKRLTRLEETVRRDR